MMLTPTIKGLIALNGYTRQQVAAALGLALAQGVTNKYARDSFSGQDLIKIANLCGCRLAFVDDKGQAILTFPELPATQERTEGN